MKLFRSLRRLFRGAYNGAGHGRRLSRWQAPQGSANAFLLDNLEVLQARSREAVRNNPYAARILETLASNIVGTGIKPQPLANSPMKEQIDTLWSAWTDEADLEGLHDFYGLQALILRSIVESGECLVRLVAVREAPTVPLQLQVLESEFLDNRTTTLPNGHRLVGGIELDAQGRRVAYHLFKRYPGESGLEANTSVRVRAEDVLHLYRPLRPGQVRGEPWLARVLLKLHELDQYDDAELVRKKTAAMFAGFVTRLDNETPLFGEGAPNEAGQALAGLEPGTMQFLDPGEDIKFSAPGDVGGSYEVFMRQQLRSIAVGMGITYEQLTGDLAGVSYSSIRAGLLEFRRSVEMLQHHLMVFQLCRPVWNRWFELAVLSHKLPLEADARVKWIPQGFEWVDPLKTIQAHILSMQHGLRSRAEIVSEMGYDVEDVDAEIAADQAREAKLGLNFNSQTQEINDENLDA